MDEIADLIRLLAEAPAEEAPMSRPKEMLDRIAIEKAVREGIVPTGPAVPGAVAVPPERVSGQQTEPPQAAVSPGRPSQFNFRTQESQRPAEPRGATADPITGMPNIPVKVQVMSPETFMGRVATPQILQAIAGMPANPQQNETRIGVANPSPRAQVTISVPPAFPIDPLKAFAAVDREIDLPPRQSPIPVREIPANLMDLQLESTEALVARSYQALEGSRSDLDRWSL